MQLTLPKVSAASESLPLRRLGQPAGGSRLRSAARPRAAQHLARSLRRLGAGLLGVPASHLSPPVRVDVTSRRGQWSDTDVRPHLTLQSVPRRPDPARSGLRYLSGPLWPPSSEHPAPTPRPDGTTRHPREGQRATRPEPLHTPSIPASTHSRPGPSRGRNRAGGRSCAISDYHLEE